MSAFSDLLQARFARLLARARGGVARIASSLEPAGRWVQGSHREPGGVLALAPLLGRMYGSLADVAYPVKG